MSLPLSQPPPANMATAQSVLEQCTNCYRTPMPMLQMLLRLQTPLAVFYHTFFKCCRSVAALPADMQSMTFHCACRFVDLRTQNGLGPVHYAVHAKATRALAVLINNSANISVTSSHDTADSIMSGPAGSSPLHLAAAVGSEEVALQLLQTQVQRGQVLCCV